MQTKTNKCRRVTKNKRIKALKIVLSATMLVILGLSFHLIYLNEEPEDNGIYGSWYVSHDNSAEENSIYKYTFYEHGNKCKVLKHVDIDRDESYDISSASLEYKYNEESGIIDIPYIGKGNIIITDNTMTLIPDKRNYENKFIFTRVAKDAVIKNPSYKSSMTYYKTITDRNGFCIIDNELLAYIGDAETVTIPVSVNKITAYAFSADLKHGTNVKTVTIPGNVKRIEESAFEFSTADKIIIDEGVEEIGDNAFSNCYLKQIYFPKSIKLIGSSILETEEGLDDAVIYVKGASEIEKYFAHNLPYGTSTLKIN